MASSHIDSVEKDEFFAGLNEGWSQVLSSGTRSVVRRYRIATSIIEISYSHPRLENLVGRALRPLPDSLIASSALKIFVFDSQTTRFFPPSPLLNVEGLTRGEISQLSSDGCFVSLFDTILHAYNPVDRTAFVWAPTFENLPPAVQAAPFLPLFHWWALENQLAFIHAAAVGHPHGGVLLAGKGGSGKSTSALACLNSKVGYLSDDYCLVDSSEGTAYGVFNSGKADLHSRKLLPHLNVLSRNQDCPDKEVFFLADHFDDQLIREFPIKAILLPTIRGIEPFSVTRISGIAALTALAPSSILQLAYAGSLLLSRIAELTRKVPAYRLSLNSRVEELPEFLDQFLTSLHS